MLFPIYIPRRVSYKKQELFILQELLASSQGFGGNRVVIYISNNGERLIRSRNCLSFRSSCVHPRVLVRSVLLHMKVTRRVSYEKQELFILQELLGSSPGLVGTVLLHI